MPTTRNETDSVWPSTVWPVAWSSSPTPAWRTRASDAPMKTGGGWAGGGDSAVASCRVRAVSAAASPGAGAAEPEPAPAPDPAPSSPS